MLSFYSEIKFYLQIIQYHIVAIRIEIKIFCRSQESLK